MDHKFPVMLGQECVGDAWVRKQGLFYKITCICRFSGEVPFRIIAKCGANEVDLGTCMIAGVNYTLESFFPISKLGAGEIAFQARPRKKSFTQQFIPIRSDEPFAYLSDLENAYLCYREKEPGIILK